MQKKKTQPKRKKNNIGSVRETDRERKIIELACGRWSVYETLAWVSDDGFQLTHKSPYPGLDRTVYLIHCHTKNYPSLEKQIFGDISVSFDT